MPNETVTIRKTTLILVVALVIVFALGLIGGLAISGAFSNKGTGNQPTGNQGPMKFDIPSFAPFEGSNSATINFIEFGDYQCPFCEAYFSQAGPQITQNYVDTGKVKFYFLDFAFLGIPQGINDSLTLAQGAWCANDQGKYYDYHDNIYSHQGQENSGWGTPVKVKALAAKIPGLDTQTFNICLDGQKYASRVEQLTQLGQNSGVTGTPSFLIGNAQKGYLSIVGACPFSSFQQAIDTELNNKNWSDSNCVITIY